MFVLVMERYEDTSIARVREPVHTPLFSPTCGAILRYSGPMRYPGGVETEHISRPYGCSHPQASRAGLKQECRCAPLVQRIAHAGEKTYPRTTSSITLRLSPHTLERAAVFLVSFPLFFISRRVMRLFCRTVFESAFLWYTPGSWLPIHAAMPLHLHEWRGIAISGILLLVNRWFLSPLSHCHVRFVRYSGERGPGTEYCPALQRNERTYCFGSTSMEVRVLLSLRGDRRMGKPRSRYARSTCVGQIRVFASVAYTPCNEEEREESAGHLCDISIDICSLSCCPRS